MLPSGTSSASPLRGVSAIAVSPVLGYGNDYYFFRPFRLNGQKLLTLRHLALEIGPAESLNFLA
jgi:hypothetical protein